ncbi:hypothetical protein PHMEG_00025807 [Phytophthora megakarya]|uniref:Uncharacterized protein n=1 Tax=Phytophthora megakarya TaxID=4795 RepID=A0A225VB46_9STRA|nr:hypothetical protein PHMEG_00025807 [Phytophthora megakarya]
MNQSDVEQRWGFVAPWCQLVLHHVHYTRFKCEGDGRETANHWQSKSPHLEVTLPKRSDYHRPHLQHEPTYQLELLKIREALAVLATVGRVDPEGWKYLLMTHCQVNWWKPGQEHFPAHLPVCYVLKMEDPLKVGTDLTKFCGVDQRERPSAEYVETMKRIAELHPRVSSEKGLDLEIPVRVAYIGQGNSFEDGYQDQLLKGLTSVARAEKAIRREWERHFKNGGKRDVDRGSIRSTFVLEPMVADIQEVKAIAKAAGTLERLLFNNVWFSLLSIKAKCPESDQAESLIAFRQLMIAVFDGAKRGPELAKTKYRTLASSVKPLQLGSLVLHNDVSLDPLETEALFSAMVLNQTTQKLSVWMDLMSHEEQKTNFWWKWLAYGCFSKRAQTYSALQGLELSNVGSLSIADVEAFLTIVDSDSPEELLYGCPRGMVPGKEATLKDGAMVQFLLHTFSDDGNSEWVNVIVPGFAMSNGFPRLLAAIGSSLLHLTIENPGDIVDTGLILRCCPNLRKLSMNRGLVDVEFKFDGGRATNQAISTMRLDWGNIESLAVNLANVSNSLAQCVSELRVRLTRSGETDERQYDPHTVGRSLEALLMMLSVNKQLEYLEVAVSAEHEAYLTRFRSHHHQVIGHILSRESKLALLSVPNKKLQRPTKAAKKVCSTPGLRTLASDVDQDTWSLIFAYAAEPVIRRVCFRA